MPANRGLWVTHPVHLTIQNEGGCAFYRAAMHDSVTVHIDAPPEEVWGLVSDITNTGRFSPETFEAEWLDGADEPAVGVRFRGHVRRNGRGPTYWTVCRITECEPARSFEFDVLGPGDRVVNTWRYDFEPEDDGAAATESFRLAANVFTRIYWAVAGRWRNRTNVEGMRQTLERVKAVAEGGSADPAAADEPRKG